MGGQDGYGYTATNEEELWRALHAAKNNGDELAVIDVKLDKYDISPRLRRLTEQLKKRVIR
jgi:TPP-dependent 2-oxoacid decarboxylase